MADAGGLRPLPRPLQILLNGPLRRRHYRTGGTVKRIPVEIRSQAWRRLWRAGRSEISLPSRSLLSRRSITEKDRDGWRSVVRLYH